MVNVFLKDLRCVMTQVVVCNCHLHYMTAKRATGFAEAANRFWRELAAAICEHNMRILAGEFNLSLWAVAREMRRLGLQISLAAAYAWNDEIMKAVMNDSRVFSYHRSHDEQQARVGSERLPIREY